MKNLVLGAFGLAVVAISGCTTYGGMAAVSGDRVIMTHNHVYFGVIQTKDLFVCKVTDTGLTNCVSTDSP